MSAENFEALLAQKSINASELETLLTARSEQKINFVLIDTREKYERMRRHIDGTDVVLHASGFYPKVKTLKDKDRLYILYCSNGSRSALNAQNMRELGYKRVLNLSKGIESCSGKIIKTNDDVNAP
ncbi:MAG: rhodanese-like domain-containing protein [Helicobacteraceae bacterium]|nr:rhodanese-like domain-containing protein [Helicobacteraceae bacterium]